MKKNLLLIFLVLLFLPVVVFAQPKMLWFECKEEPRANPGGDEFCLADIKYYDTSVSPAQIKIAESNVVIQIDESSGAPHRVVAGSTTNFPTIDNVEVRYLIYFKDGKIYRLHTETLGKTQISNETNATIDNLCWVREYEVISESNIFKHAIIYEYLASGEQWCNSGRNVRRMVKVGTYASSSPINVGTKVVEAQLLDGTGRFFVIAGSPPNLSAQICNANLSSCTTFDTLTDYPDDMPDDFSEIDRNYFIYVTTGGMLKSYKYTPTSGLKTLYTAQSGESILESVLGGDGYVYFATYSPGSLKIKKVPVGGETVTNVTSQSLSYNPHEVLICPGDNYLFYMVPNSNFSSVTGYSVSKSGGTSTLLGSNIVFGWCSANKAFWETADGKVQKKNFDGTGLETKSNAIIAGFTFGGKRHWYRLFDENSFTFLIQDRVGDIWAYGLNQNIQNPGIKLGRLPINLSNAKGWSFSAPEMLLYANKRNLGISTGTDIIYLKTNTATSLKRVTNTSTYKLPALNMDAD